MKFVILFLLLSVILNMEVKTGKIESRVYSYSKAKVEKNERGERRQIMDGETTHMENFEIHVTTLNPGAIPHGKAINKDREEIIFMKEGRLKVTLNNESKVIGAGSVVLLLPGDEYDVVNGWDKPTTYYLIGYKSKVPMNIERGKANGGSMLIDWDKLKFQPHDRGGQRSFFDRKSAMSERIEMHATTLNPAIKSHEPHTHSPEEIVIMMSGTTEMEIGDGTYPGVTGDIYFMGSNIPHAIRNTGKEPCTYLAFQLE